MLCYTYIAFHIKITTMALPLCLVLQADRAVKCEVSCLMFTTQQAAGMLSKKLALCESPSDWHGSSCLDSPCDILNLPWLWRQCKWHTFSALRQSSQNSCSFPCTQYFTKKTDYISVFQLSWYEISEFRGLLPPQIISTHRPLRCYSRRRFKFGIYAN